MSRKLYVFGIGGTGSRVIKALTMLLSAGVELGNNFDIVIPIIIDPDINNGDLTRTKEILGLYQEIRNEIYQPIRFFKQQMKTINELADEDNTINPNYFQFHLEDVDDNTFGDYIGFDSLEDNYAQGWDDKSFIKLLFSEGNLLSKLDVGFKGHPNMGTIVLDQFTDSENFRKFATTFAEGDAIFIINSIFGGTGAAGYPLLLKNLRGNKVLPKHEKIKNSYIGAFTMLPYFALNDSDEIDAESFEQKAIAAIDYYNRTIIDTNQIDYQYFVGKKGINNFQDYSVGGDTQKNKAHFLELTGALAVLDFCQTIPEFKEDENFKTKIREFGLERFENDIISFTDMNADNVRQIAKPLTSYYLFADFLNRHLKKSFSSRWTKKGFFRGFRKTDVFSDLTKKYFDSQEYKNQIKRYNHFFMEWMQEMKDNKPSFAPFIDTNDDTAFSLVKDRSPKEKTGFDKIDIINNELISRDDIRNTNGKKHSLLIKLFDESIHKALDDLEIFKQEN